MNDPELVRMEYAWDFTPQSEAAISKTLLRYMEDTEAGTSYHLRIENAATDELIGYCGIILIDKSNYKCTPYLVIGDRENWGKGYGKEILQALIDFAFNELNMNRMETHIYAYNHRSCRLFEGKGFRQEGMKKKARFIQNEFVDEYIYALYSGRKLLDDRITKGNEVYVFDYKGNPVKKLILDKDISFFDISKENKMYAISVDILSQLLKFDLNKI